jgi:hypothetical protein
LEWQKISPTLQSKKISPTLQSVLRTFTSSAEPVSLLNNTTRPTRFGGFHLTTSDIMMSCANDTTRLLVPSDISTFMFEMGRADWSSINPVIQQIRYGHRLLIYKATSRAHRHGTDDLASDKGNLRIAFAV